MDQKPPHNTPEPAMDDLVVGSWLVQAGVITSDQLIQAIRHSKDRTCSLRDALITLRFMPSTAPMPGQMAAAPPAEASADHPQNHGHTGIAGFFGNFFGGASHSPEVAKSAPTQTTPNPYGQLHQTAQGFIATGQQPQGQTGTGSYPAVANQELREVEMRQSLRVMIDNKDTPELTDALFSSAIDSRSTDIHFDPRETDYRIRFRVDGLLHDIITIPYEQAISVVSRIKILANLDIVERRSPQDGRISHNHNDRRHDLRVSTMPSGYGEKIVLRVHDAIAEIIGLNQLGLSRGQDEVLLRLLQQPNGMILASGPVGSGKTTTLYSFMGAVNTPTRNLMSIEDPIEYRLDGVNQVQVDGRAEVGFSEGLRAMLRQDPDVIMIGEIRDDETAQIGLRAALTGVLVFSSTHAGDAATTISNLHNFSVPNFMLAGGLLGIVGQRLVRKVCPYCQIKRKPDPARWQLIGLPEEELADAEVSFGQGCPACFHTGYLGRVGVFEILEVDEEIRGLIMRKSPKDLIRQSAEAKGMQTLRTSVVDLIRSGVTTIEEALRVVPM